MTDRTLTLAAAETALRDIIGRVHYDSKLNRYDTYITLAAALDALRGVAGDRDEALKAADALAHECDLMLGDEGSVAQDFEDALTTYRQKRGQDHD